MLEKKRMKRRTELQFQLPHCIDNESAGCRSMPNFESEFQQVGLQVWGGSSSPSRSAEPQAEESGMNRHVIGPKNT